MWGMVKMSYDIGRYVLPFLDYQDSLQKDRLDFTNRVPLKRTEIKQENHVGRGVLGYTILNHDYMVRRDGLFGKLYEEVDVHELIHNEWEYQTDIIAKWMVSDMGNKYRVSFKSEKGKKYHFEFSKN